jgi:hypothetical protein
MGEGTRQHPRVVYRAHVLLMGTGTPGPETRPLIGRSLNLSASGLLVEADEPCLELAASDRALLEGVVSGHETPAELVTVRFDGVAHPLQSRAVITPEGVELRTALPFLRIDSSVEVSFGVGGGRLVRHGILRDVRVDRAAHDGAPYLAVSVTLHQEQAQPVNEDDEEVTASRPR